MEIFIPLTFQSCQKNVVNRARLRLSRNLPVIVFVSSTNVSYVFVVQNFVAQFSWTFGLPSPECYGTSVVVGSSTIIESRWFLRSSQNLFLTPSVVQRQVYTLGKIEICSHVSCGHLLTRNSISSLLINSKTSSFSLNLPGSLTECWVPSGLKRISLAFLTWTW